MPNTANFNFPLIPLDTIPWKESMDDIIHTIDAVLAKYVNITNVIGVWKVATVVTVGQRYVDDVDDTLWEVLVAHTTHSTRTFAQDRAANPTYWISVSGIGPADFESSEVDITVDTEYTEAHSLTAIPNLCQVVLKCKTAEHGYTIDDEIVVTNSMDADAGTTVFMNTTNVVVVVGSAINILSVTTNNAVAITAASWKLIMRAWL